jgi:hypothetical protein
MWKQAAAISALVLLALGAAAQEKKKEAAQEAPLAEFKIQPGEPSVKTP